MLEYLAMAVIVMVAIMFGGPMLVNSIGARFKITEDNVGDSFSEKLTQAAPEKCACNPGTNNPSTWPVKPGASCGALPCGPMELNRQRLCPGCTPDKEEKCAQSRTCCSAWVKDACGTVAQNLKDTLCVGREAWDLIPQPPPEGTVRGGRCLDTNGGPRGCLTSEMAYTATCGEGVTKVLCVLDGSNCEAECVGAEWKPLTTDYCEGVEFTQNDGCGHEKQAFGEKKPECLPASEVPCGEKITSGNECPAECPGTGTSNIECETGFECDPANPDECKKICKENPPALYMGARYWKACDNTGNNHAAISCPVGDNSTWFRTVYHDGGRWWCAQCGRFYRAGGKFCHGDPCARGMQLVPNDGNSVVFHMGKYNAVTGACDWDKNIKKVANQSVPQQPGNNAFEPIDGCQGFYGTYGQGGWPNGAAGVVNP